MTCSPVDLSSPSRLRSSRSRTPWSRSRFIFSQTLAAWRMSCSTRSWVDKGSYSSRGRALTSSRIVTSSAAKVRHVTRPRPPP